MASGTRGKGSRAPSPAEEEVTNAHLLRALNGMKQQLTSVEEQLAFLGTKGTATDDKVVALEAVVTGHTNRIAELEGIVRTLEDKNEWLTRMVLDFPEILARSNSFMCVLPIPADANTNERLVQHIADQFQKAKADLLPLGTIRDVVKVASNLVKIDCCDPSVCKKVLNNKRALRLLNADKKLVVFEDLSRDMQAQQKALQPVLHYLQRTTAPGDYGPVIRGGVLLKHVKVGDKWVPEAHKANWTPSLVDKAKEALAAMAALQQAGQPAPPRDPELA